jgi:steroid delta-isomerase-like uncharacterized protein
MTDNGATHNGAIQLARRFVSDVLAAGDLGRADDLVADDVVVHVPVRPEPLRGLAALKEYIATFRAALPDVGFVIEDEIAQDDRVVLRLTVDGTHRGELLGVAPTGKRISVPEVLILRVSGGRIVEDWVQVDLLGLLAQLGALPGR